MTTTTSLSKKQQQVLTHLEKGRTPKEIAKKMGVTVTGIYGHMRRIERKGHTVPRSGQSKPATPTPAKASTNGHSQYGKETLALIELAERRAETIKSEIEVTEAEVEERKKTLDKLIGESDLVEGMLGSAT